MTKVFIDTSIFIRFLTKDDVEKYNQCAKFFDLVELGKLRSYTSNIVILEIQFVLIRLYKFPKDKVLEDINNLLSLRNLTLIEKSNTQEAIAIYQKQNIKYPDCLIATQIPVDTKMVSYDTDFSKIKNLPVALPEDFL